MAPYPEDVDVFTVPHSRMKGLVNDYAQMIKKTNFTNDLDLSLLLESLLKTFMEFKTHEQIENQLIMNKLKHKLKQLSIKNTAVCNCHSDDQLSQMMTFIKTGYEKKTVQDRINYGLKLEKALEDFTCTFIPHMQEEEEVFQPLLLQYFSYEEIRDLKKRVIQQHITREQALLEEQLLQNIYGENLEKVDAVKDEEVDEYCKDFSDQTKEKDKEKAEKLLPSIKQEEDSFLKIPSELKLRIFSYMNPSDLGRCAQVNWDWNHHALDPSLWSDLYPVHWAKGKWDVGNKELNDDECCDDCLEDEESDNYVVDDDADIDESVQPETDEYDDIVQRVKSEAVVLRAFVKYILPKVGGSVKKLVLRKSCALTNGMLNKIIQLCPNIEYIDLTQTRISDAGLKSIGVAHCGRKLKHVILSGCVNITDATLIRLAVSQHQSAERTLKCDPCPINAGDASPEKNSEDHESFHASPAKELKGELLNQHASRHCHERIHQNRKSMNNDVNTEKFDLECLCDLYYKECQVSIKAGCTMSNHHCKKSYSADKELIPSSQISCVSDVGAVMGALKSVKSIITSGQELQKRNDKSGYYAACKSKEVTVQTNTSMDSICHSLCKSITKTTDDTHGEIQVEECVKGLSIDRTDAMSSSKIKTEIRLKYDNHNEHYSALDRSMQVVRMNYDLQCLNLSGCFQITDVGLQAIARIGIFPKMRHLDLSGCLRLNPEGIHYLVNSCPNLQPHKLYYCDNIIGGPYEDTASGCQNLECNSRFCCRSGE